MAMIEKDMEVKSYRFIVDFDMHLEDCRLDFQNKFVKDNGVDDLEESIEDKKNIWSILNSYIQKCILCLLNNSNLI